MKSYFRTINHREKMTQEDIDLLTSRLKRDKMLSIIFLILTIVTVYLLGSYTFFGDVFRGLFEYELKGNYYFNFAFTMMLFFGLVGFPIVFFVQIYAITNIKKGMKKGVVKVVRGVLTGKEFAGRSRAPYFWIGGSSLVKVGFWHDWKFEEGMCVEYKSMNKDYFVSLRRYDNEMYDVEKTAKKENMPEIKSFRKKLGNNI